MFAAIRLFLGRFITPFLWKFFLGASIAGLIGWAVVEFQARGFQIEALENAKQKVEEFYSQKLKTERARVRQAEDDLESARAIAERRQVQNEKLEKQVSKIRQMERPDEDKGCPIHPAIRGSIDQLREQPGDKDQDETGGS